MTSQQTLFDLVEAVECSARPVFLPVGQLQEQVCIAFIGISALGAPWASAVASKPLACLPNDLGEAISTFGNLVADDYSEWCARGQSPKTWEPPIAGLRLGDWILADGFDGEDAVRVCLSLAAFAGSHKQVQTDAPSVLPGNGPRTSEERRFLDAICEEIGRTRPSLRMAFRRDLSLTGKATGGEIDFVGSHYVTCYAAVNPKSKATSRVQTAFAALWRLARARDAFGFATPTTIELTAWVPPEGLPIYSAHDYTVASETVAELREQASREELDVFAVFDVQSACRRLIDVEISRAVAHS